MDGKAQPSQIAGLLMALAMKGERPAEVVGFAQTMRDEGDAAVAATIAPVFDTCGTGGDRAHTFNVSTVAALVLAACGVRVAKHGNRSVSSRCGSADLFEALGVNVAAEPAVVERCLADAGIAFFFAPTFHPSMRHAGPARKELGVRTAFNLLGPLTNPAGAARQLVGVPRPELTELVARSLALLGSERAWVVHGADGLDEISTGGYTKVSECRDGEVNTFYLHPTDIGLSQVGAGRPARRRCRGQRRHRPSRARRRAGPAAGRRAPQHGGGAAHRRQGRPDSRRPGDGGGGRRQRPGGRVSSKTDATVDGTGAVGRPAETAPPRLEQPMTQTSSADLLGTIVAATERIVEVRAREVSDQRAGTALRDGWPAAAGRGVRTGAARVAGAASHRRVQTPLTVARHPAGTTTTRPRTRAPTRRPARRRSRCSPSRRSSTARSSTSNACARRCRCRCCARTSSSRAYQLLEAVARGRGRRAADRRRARRSDTPAAARRQATALGLACLVEVHDTTEIARAVDAGARVVGVNSRNLRTLAVDLDVLDRAASLLPAGVTAVAESGIKTTADIARCRRPAITRSWSASG